MNTRAVVIIILVALSFVPAAFVGADTVYFNNGGTIEGIIKSEDASNVQMDIGFGTITCDKREIMKIERSSAADTEVLTEKWERKRQELKDSEEEFARERQKRFAEYEKQIREEREKKEKELTGQGTVNLARDLVSGNILVDSLVNGNVKAMLVLDTGASIVVLTRQKGEELGLDLSPDKNIATLQLAGSHKAAAKMVMLKSVRINDIEVKDVLAGVLLEDPGIGFKDGLLGMTFLNRFNLKIDLKNMKMSLEKAG